MPKLIELHNQEIGVVKGQAIDPQSAANGKPKMMDTWTVVLTDRTYGDQIRLPLEKKGRDDLVRMLTGGIVLAGGELPSI